MTMANMFQAKTELSKLVRMLENKEEDCVLLCRNGKPVAKIVPLEKKKRTTGLTRSDYVPMTQEEFDACNDEIAAMFGVI